MNLRDLVDKTIDKYTLTEVLGEGSYGITFKATDAIQGFVAIKILKNNVEGWEAEAYKASKLRDIPQIAMVFDIGSTKNPLEDSNQKLNYIVWEYVNGITLADIFEKGHTISTSFIIDLTEQMCHAIKQMQDVNLQHGDLHSNNIILIQPKEWDPEPKLRVKIVDFGLAKSVRGTKFKLDMEYLAVHLQKCWTSNRVYAGEMLVSDKKFQSLLTELIKRMTDPNIEHRLLDPVETIKRIYQIQEEKDENSVFRNVSLSQPFEYLSAEEMPENSDLIQDLYADNVPWLKEIEGFGTTVVSGPRGSGKSMILKNMRLLTKLRSLKFPTDQQNTIHFLGFYLQCQHNLYYPFAGLNIDYTEKVADKFIHYLNLLFTSEILESLIILEDLDILKFTSRDKNNLISFLKEHIIHEDTDSYFLSSKNVLNQLKSIVEKEILFVQKRIQKNEDFKKQTSLNYLQSFIKVLDNVSDFFKDKSIYFLLDDYSKPKINIPLQKSINRLISYRNSRFCFKITTEKFGFVQIDLDDKTLEQDREYSFIDLGTRFIKANKSDRKEFIKNILNKRLKRANIKLDAVQFFGPQQFDGKIALQLMTERKKGTSEYQSRFEYAGLNVIYKLCLGDLSTILQLCKEIYHEAESENNNFEHGINSKIQDTVIRRFSTRRLEMIKELSNVGMKLYQLVESFGIISKKYLYDYDKSNKMSPYLEVLRIELTETTDCLCPDNEELYKQLIANNIFLDGGGIYAWGQGIPNIKLILRPIYTPALKISYSDRYAIRIKCESFQKFLHDPENFSKTGNRLLRKLETDQQTLDSELFTIGKRGDIVNEE